MSCARSSVPEHVLVSPALPCSLLRRSPSMCASCATEPPRTSFSRCLPLDRSCEPHAIPFLHGASHVVARMLKTQLILFHKMPFCKRQTLHFCGFPFQSAVLTSNLVHTNPVCSAMDGHTECVTSIFTSHFSAIALRIVLIAFTSATSSSLSSAPERQTWCFDSHSSCRQFAPVVCMCFAIFTHSTRPVASIITNVTQLIALISINLAEQFVTNNFTKYT